MSKTFPLSRHSTLGYNVDEVEIFLAAARKAYADGGDSRDGVSLDSETIRRAAFSLEKGGYSTTHVDAAMERLEDAFSARERTRVQQELGDQKWRSLTTEKAREILARLERGAGKRFQRVGSLTTGYNRNDVDRFSEALIGYFRSGAAVTVEDVRTAVFRTKLGGYNELQVDLFLDAVVDVMLAVR